MLGGLREASRATTAQGVHVVQFDVCMFRRRELSWQNGPDDEQLVGLKHTTNCSVGQARGWVDSWSGLQLWGSSTAGHVSREFCRREYRDCTELYFMILVDVDIRRSAAAGYM